MSIETMGGRFPAYGRRERRHSANLQLRLEPQELAAIKKAAAAANLPVSTWLRAVAKHAADLQHNLRVLAPHGGGK